MQSTVQPAKSFCYGSWPRTADLDFRMPNAHETPLDPLWNGPSGAVSRFVLPEPGGVRPETAEPTQVWSI